MICLVILFLGGLVLLSGCATPENDARFQNRTERREEMVDAKLDRTEGRSSRWQRMKEWEDERYRKMWDNIMD